MRRWLLVALVLFGILIYKSAPAADHLWHQVAAAGNHFLNQAGAFLAGA